MPDRFGDNEWPTIPSPGQRPPAAEDVDAVRALDIVNCSLCNDEGLRGLHICDHRTDHAAAAARGMAAIREILDRKASK